MTKLILNFNSKDTKKIKKPKNFLGGKGANLSEMGKMGRTHVLENYGHDMFSDLWQKTFKEALQKYGSWENRKNYDRWQLMEVA